MSNSHNPLLEVASLRMKFSRRFLADYSHPKSPRKFTQVQLMSCLVLKAYLQTTYRGVIDILDASDKLKTRLGLERLPHYSTLKYFADKPKTLEIIDAILAAVAQEYGGIVQEASSIPPGLVVSWGPYNDRREAPALFAKARPVIQPRRLFTEATLRALAYALRL